MIPTEWLQYAPKPKAVKPGEWNVFLSYRSVNRPWVLHLYDVLTELGYKVFLDQYVLKPGDELITVLEDALEKSQTGVLIWSNAAKDSDWVRKEYNTLERMSTGNDSFRFVPVLVEPTKLPPFAANKIFVDFTEYPDGPNGGDLLRLLHAIVGIPLGDEAVHFASEQDEISKEQVIKVNAAIKNGNAEKLKQLSEQDILPWKTSSALGCRAANGLIKMKRYDDALVVLEKIAKRFKKAVRPQQLKALAFAKRGNEGDLDNAMEILGELHESNHLDPETMGIYGRTWMDRYEKSKDINDLLQSRDLYAEGFEKAPDDYYTGINAASKSVFIGTAAELKKAAEYAERVQAITGTDAVPNDYWKTATIGEVLLIQKKYREAGDMYAKAVAMARTENDSHESSWLQARRLMDKLKPTDEERSFIRQAFAHLPE